MDLIALLTDLTQVPDLTWIIGPGPVVSENMPKGIKPPEIKDGTATIEADNWHFHLPLKSVTSVEFIEQDSRFPGHAPRSYLVRFNGEQGKSPLRCYFASPADGAAPRAFTELRDRYSSQPDVSFTRKTRDA